MIRNRLQAIGQEHVLAFWNQLSQSQQASLLLELESLQLQALPSLIAGHVLREPEEAAAGDSPAPARPRARAGRRAAQAGEALLAAGQVAALTVAGGQGTRLGFDGPKGAFPVCPVSAHSLFQVFADSLRGARRRYGRQVPWYIMTSFANHQATVALFAANDHFGLEAASVHFFCQGRLPSFTRDGLLVLEEKDRVAMAPDGHGGLLEGLQRSGALRSLRDHGIRHLSCFQVDNPMVRCLDPVFLGMHELEGSELSSKSLARIRDDEGLGSFCLRDGKLVVIEYSELPAELASARNADGTRVYEAGSISIYAFAVEFLERLAEAGVRLPLHRAIKRQRAIDVSTGARTTVEVIKLERFVFDLLPHARRTLLVETERAEEFAPVKNLTGEDSVASCKRQMVRRAAGWLERSGVHVPRDEQGEPLAVLEISPLLAGSARELSGQVDPAMQIEPGCWLFLR